MFELITNADVFAPDERAKNFALMGAAFGGGFILGPVLGGFLGELIVKGNLEPFVQLLRTAEIIHVGKGATFGLGKMEIQPV